MNEHAVDIDHQHFHAENFLVLKTPAKVASSAWTFKTSRHFFVAAEPCKSPLSIKGRI
jgi:hypothetical protein